MKTTSELIRKRKKTFIYINGKLFWTKNNWKIENFKNSKKRRIQLLIWSKQSKQHVSAAARISKNQKLKNSIENLIQIFYLWLFVEMPKLSNSGWNRACTEVYRQLEPLNRETITWDAKIFVGFNDQLRGKYTKIQEHYSNQEKCKKKRNLSLNRSILSFMLPHR